MRQLLQETHRQENINLLKARDYYFDKARNWNRWIRVLVFLPAIIMALTYIPCIPDYEFIDSYRDVLVGVMSILSFVLIHLLCKPKIDENLSISNKIREYYDCKVFGIPANPFAFQENDIRQYLGQSKYVHDDDKYELWYQEIFCDSHPRNVICSQMDNVVYTYHAYKSYWRFLNVYYIFTIALSLLALALNAEVFILVLLSLFNIIQYCFENQTTASSLIKRNLLLMQTVKSQKEQLLQALDSNDMAPLRMIQDIILSNREASILIPKFIRFRHLKDDSPFYEDLNEFKDIFLKKETTDIPSCADDIDIFNLEETETIKLKEIQERLLIMLKDVIRVFEKYGIVYTLDGGSLIGAVRSRDLMTSSVSPQLTGGGFVFWDDDIDLAIPTTCDMLEKAKKALHEELGEKYDIQDYQTDSYYSPRLSNFRIRDKKSIITEKDSPLFELYSSRGLFIDVYAYSPILLCRPIDCFFRLLFIHPLNRKIHKIENDYPAYSCPSGNNEEHKLKRHLEHFSKLKRIYLSYVKWYIKHAKCEKYYAYVPNYIDKLTHPGPYIKKEYLYGKTVVAEFEGMILPIPTDPDMVLRAYYDKWYISPFQSKELLIKESKDEKNWFSKKQFRITVMKHIGKVSLF